MKNTLFFLLLSSTLLLAEFTRDDVNSTVTDNRSGLQWQDDLEVLTFTTWQGAIDRCEALTLDGAGDWRLPNKNELYSIVDRSVFGPAINPVFHNTASSIYWSSTTYRFDPADAWQIGFTNGLDVNAIKSGNGYVRCVRGGQ